MTRDIAIVTVSDRSFRKEREDLSGPALAKYCVEHEYKVVYKSIVPDEKDLIKNEIIEISKNKNIALILTTGGTGFAKRDVTPEATIEACDKLANGISEAMRYKSMEITDRAMLSRGVSGIIGNTLVINLPGSPKAAVENFSFVAETIKHGLDVLRSSDGFDCNSK